MEDVKAYDGRMVAVSNVKAGKGHSEDGWDRDRGVNNALANAC
jgi:hypothetical protein